METWTKKDLFLFSLYITGMVLVNTVGSKSSAGVRVSVGIFHAGALSDHRHRRRSARTEAGYTFRPLPARSCALMLVVTAIFVSVKPTQPGIYSNHTNRFWNEYENESGKPDQFRNRPVC